MKQVCPKELSAFVVEGSSMNSIAGIWMMLHDVVGRQHFLAPGDGLQKASIASIESLSATRALISQSRISPARGHSTTSANHGKSRREFTSCADGYGLDVVAWGTFVISCLNRDWHCQKTVFYISLTMAAILCKTLNEIISGACRAICIPCKALNLGCETLGGAY